MSVLIETTMGDIVVDLYIKERPRCCLNFLKLCKTKYFNFCLFHSVQRNFVIQTGDPTGTGKGGESVFKCLYGDQARYFEAEKLPKLKHVKLGTLSMVNDGNDLHGSQFLFTLRENLDSLDGIHTVFGEVTEGLDILMKINDQHCDRDYRPYQDIRISHTIIIDDPLDDPEYLQIPDKSPDRPSKEEVVALRIGADEEINPDEKLDDEEIKEKEEKQEAKHHAQVLEIIGDIPDKDVKPPDNVLFVCKLNALTTSEDLEIIFSRFGTINSCEIICDYKTGASLQYAFIEFENAEMCEKAYHKMDNVLIDDRRIHVDFSQSVSRVKYPQFWKRMKETNNDHENPKDQNEEDQDEESIKKKKHKNSDHQSEIRGGKHSKYSRHSDHRRHQHDSDVTQRHRRRHEDRREERLNHCSSTDHRRRKEKSRRRSRSESRDTEVRCGKHRKYHRERR